MSLVLDGSTGAVSLTGNVAGGSTGNLVYQSGVGATAFLGDGTAGQLLQSAGAAAPAWANVSAPTAITNLVGGTAGQVPYQSAPNVTSFLPVGATGQVLTTGGAGAAPSWQAPTAGAFQMTYGGVLTASTVTLTTADYGKVFAIETTNIVRLPLASGGDAGKIITFELPSYTTGGANWSVNIQCSLGSGQAVRMFGQTSATTNIAGGCGGWVQLMCTGTDWVQTGGSQDSPLGTQWLNATSIRAVNTAYTIASTRTSMALVNLSFTAAGTVSIQYAPDGATYFPLNTISVSGIGTGLVVPMLAVFPTLKTGAGTLPTYKVVASGVAIVYSWWELR